jgi:hypothetical protein
MKLLCLDILDGSLALLAYVGWFHLFVVVFISWITSMGSTIVISLHACQCSGNQRMTSPACGFIYIAIFIYY